MATLLLRLSNVPEDELVEVCQLLDEANIGHYQTTAGFWGAGLAGLWLADDNQFEETKALLNDYQQERYQRMHALPVESFCQRSFRQPLKLLLSVLAIGAIGYFSLVPFLDMYS